MRRETAVRTGRRGAMTAATLAVPLHTLPAPLTPLVGREREAAAVSDLIARPDVRLVTLTDPAGVGKTRLGLRVAARAAADFPDRVVFVPLAATADPGLVQPAIARAIGVREPGDQPVAVARHAALCAAAPLLLLDNFEQVIGAAPPAAGRGPLGGRSSGRSAARR